MPSKQNKMKFLCKKVCLNPITNFKIFAFTHSPPFTFNATIISQKIKNGNSLLNLVRIQNSCIDFFPQKGV